MSWTSLFHFLFFVTQNNFAHLCQEGSLLCLLRATQCKRGETAAIIFAFRQGGRRPVLMHRLVCFWRFSLRVGGPCASS